MQNKIFTTTAAALCTLLISTNAASAGYGQEGKIYTKLELGYGVQDQDQAVTGLHVGSTSGSGYGFLGNVGLGYYLMDELRVDFSVQYDQGLTSKGTFQSGANTVTMRGEDNGFGGFVNVYYDWLNTSNITPYATLGAGFMRNEYTSRIEISGTEHKDTKTKYGIAYKAGLGMAYHMGTGVDLDFGYSYLDKGADKYNISIAPANVSVVAEPGAIHSFLFGIRLTY